MSEAEIVALLDMTPPEPGERCALCHRRRNKKRTSEEPKTKRVGGGVLPTDRADAVNEGFDNLQEYTGADAVSYPKGTLLELLLVLGAEQREALKAHFDGDSA